MPSSSSPDVRELLARRGIDLTAPVIEDPPFDPIAWRLEHYAAKLAADIPAMFHDAQPDHPDVRAWLNKHLADPTAFPALYLSGNTGTGKALLNSTQLATPDGPRAIGDMRVGDSVIGGDGKPCRVVGVYPQGVRKLWRMNLRDGRSIVCDTDHLWVVTSRRRNHVGAPPKVLSTAEIMDSGLHFTDGSARWYIPVAETVEFAATDLPVDPYTLGVLIGDGSLTGNTPGVTSADPEVIAALRLPAGVELRVRPRQRESKALTWLLSGRRPRPNPLTVALRALGLMGLQSSRRFIPDLYLRGAVDDRLALLAGLIDSDGYIKGSSASISTSSPRLADDIRRLVWSLGGVATVKPKKTPCLTSYTVHLSLPAKFGCPARLLRKRAAWGVRRDGRGSLVAIASIEPSVDGAATCIAVDSPDSTYLTADYVLTHNTHQAYGVLRHLAGVAARANRDFRWLAVTHPDLNAAARIKPDGSHAYAVDPYIEVEFLIVDDLAAGKASEFTNEHITRLIDHRWARRMATVYTTNLDPDKLEAVIGERALSRLADATLVEMGGADRRFNR